MLLNFVGCDPSIAHFVPPGSLKHLFPFFGHVHTSSFRLWTISLRTYHSYIRVLFMGI